MTSKPTKAVVLHSGGMDSSITLRLAIEELGRNNVTALAFWYGQRHSNEIGCATRICKAWGIEQKIVDIDAMRHITTNALMDASLPMQREVGESPTTLVLGRNGLFVRLAAIYGDKIGADQVWIGVLESVDGNSGYRDCSRAYMNLKEQILRIDLDNPFFVVRTPLVFMSKAESLQVAKDLGVLEYLLKETLTCYAGVPKEGCGDCPACHLRKRGLTQYQGTY